MNTMLLILLACCVASLSAAMGFTVWAITKSLRENLSNGQSNYEFLAAAAITVDPRRKDQLAQKVVHYPNTDLPRTMPSTTEAPKTGMTYEEGTNL